MREQDELQEVLNHLNLLEPTEAEQPRPAHEALAQLHTRLSADASFKQQVSLWSQLKWRFSQIMSLTVKRFAWAGLAVALLIAFFSFPSTRALANQFLGLFRVQKFAAISISPEQLARLEELDLEGLQPPGELVMFEEPGRAERVNSLDEAAAAAGMPLKTAVLLGEPQNIEISNGGSGRLTVDLESARAILDVAGIDPTLLPNSLDGADIDATIYDMVMQEWYEDDVVLVQTVSPEIDYPDNFDPSLVGQAMLQLLGMSEVDAAVLANSIDWSSTLILPIPQEFATFGEVTVNGNSGLLITAIDGSGNMVLWQADGVVYSLASDQMDANGLVNVAESLE